MIVEMMMLFVHLCHCRCLDHCRGCCRSFSSFPSSFFACPSPFSPFFLVPSVFVVFVSFLMSSFLLLCSLLMSCCGRRCCRGCGLSSPFIVPDACSLASLSELSSLSLLPLSLSDAPFPQMTMTKGSRWVVAKDIFFLFLSICLLRASAMSSKDDR